jgi:RimJ/RimL family protein N-acetyltransferase
LFRRVSKNDFDSWLPFFQDPSSFIHWNQVPDSPERECEKWFVNQINRYTQNRGGMNALIEKKTNQLIGYGGLLVQVVDAITELEIAYSLLPKFRGAGFASEAAKKCRDYGFENNLAESLISIISLTNNASANVAMKNGMEIEKQTVYKDNAVNIFRISKEKWETFQ